MDHHRQQQTNSTSRSKTVLQLPRKSSSPNKIVYQNIGQPAVSQLLLDRAGQSQQQMIAGNEDSNKSGVAELTNLFEQKLVIKQPDQTLPPRPPSTPRFTSNTTTFGSNSTYTTTPSADVRHAANIPFYTPPTTPLLTSLPTTASMQSITMTSLSSFTCISDRTPVSQNRTLPRALKSVVKPDSDEQMPVSPGLRLSSSDPFGKSQPTRSSSFRPVLPSSPAASTMVGQSGPIGASQLCQPTGGQYQNANAISTAGHASLPADLNNDVAHPFIRFQSSGDSSGYHSSHNGGGALPLAPSTPLSNSSRSVSQQELTLFNNAGYSHPHTDDSESLLRRRETELRTLRQTMELNEKAMSRTFEEKLHEMSAQLTAEKQRVAQHEAISNVLNRRAAEAESSLTECRTQLQLRLTELEENQQRLKQLTETADRSETQLRELKAGLRETSGALETATEELTRWRRTKRTGCPENINVYVQTDPEYQKAQLTTQASAFEAERTQWLEEKARVIAYQKQLQMNYVQLSRKTERLEAELHNLTVELERLDGQQPSHQWTVPPQPPTRNPMSSLPPHANQQKQYSPSTPAAGQARC